MNFRLQIETTTAVVLQTHSQATHLNLNLYKCKHTPTTVHKQNILYSNVIALVSLVYHRVRP